MIKSITGGKKQIEFLIDSEDAHVLLMPWHPQFQHDSDKLQGIYSTIHTQDGKQYTISIHRLITNCPDGMVIDHIDGNPANNCRNNLRICTTKQNTRNQSRRRDNTSGYKGVHWVPQNRKWRAMIKVEGIKIHLGLFPTPEEAHNAYCIAALKYHGEFARFD